MRYRGRRSTFAGVALTTLASIAALTACAHEEIPAPQTPRVSSAESTSSGPDSPPPLRMYILGDTQSWRSSRPSPLALVALGNADDGVGAIQEGLRLVSGTSGLRAAAETTEPAIIGGLRLPAHLGGGFLFQTQTSLYTSPTFDGPLHPLVTIPGEIGAISFGPQGVLLRGSDGERWYVDARTGNAAPMNPPGMVDIASLPDGRAAAIAEFGAALVSIDGGAHWQDVTHQLPGSPTDVVVVESELYFRTSATRGDVVRVDPGGTLVAFDKTPVVDPPLLRKRDPRWNDKYEPPIRHALRLGVPLDDRTALVVDGGNVDTVDVMTGELLDVSTGKLPPDATCEAVRTHDDILFVCSQNNAPGFVASHVLGDKPIIEQSFGIEGVFYAGDDGALAFGGSCTGTSPTAKIACVRTPSGSWQEYDLESVSDAGPQTDALRWVPRSDGGVAAIVATPKMGTIDARTGEFHSWGDSVGQYANSIRPSGGNVRDGHLVDRGWTTTPSGGLRGWVDGGAIDVSNEGVVTVSPFKFERNGRLAESGPFALAMHEGRLWQTVDRGSSWIEVAPPLSAATAASPKSTSYYPHVCSAVGCDLLEWYRIGWPPTPPLQRTPPKLASGAPHLSATSTPSIACRIEGATSASALPRTDESPDNFGLGVSRVPTVTNSDQEYIHTVYSRSIVNPPHSSDATGDPGQDAVRALLYGYGTSNDDGDRIAVLGPNKDPMALKRLVSFVAPFDTQQLVRKTSFGISEIVTAARGIGLGTMDVLAEDPSIATSFVPLLGLDATAPSDLVISGSTGLVALLHASNNAHPRITMRVKRADDAYIVGAAALAGDEIMLLEVEGSGDEHVMKWTGGTIADLFDVPPPPSTEFYPANPDAIAIGPRFDVGVLRTPSGGTPPSQQDPALIYGTNGAPIPLAPWSTLTLATDPACRAIAALPAADPNSGWRAILQTARPWLSVNAPGLKVVDDAPSLLRVRWTQSRVCLEAAEIRLPQAQVRTQQKSSDGSTASAIDVDVQTWLVARWIGTPSATRASIMLGSETRQPLECTAK